MPNYSEWPHSAYRRLSQVFLRGNFRFVGDLQEGQERFLLVTKYRFEVVVAGLKSEAGRRTDRRDNS
jgi:hypothetical protein